MFCCCGAKQQKEDKTGRQILDVQEILENYVWGKFLQFNGRFRCCVRRSNFQVEVPMNYLRFETIQQKVKERTHLGDGAVPTVLRGAEGQQTRDKDGAVELKTIFHNATPNEQTYQFRLEKTRKSAVTVTVQKGFSIGGKANFNIKLPPVTGGVGVDLKYSVTKTNGENIEETATFETRSDVKVEKNSKCEAKVIMEEVSVDCDFQMKILMTLLTEGIPASVKRKKDGKVFFTYVIGNISRVFDPYKSETVDPHPDLDKLCNGGQINGQNSNGLVGDKVLFKIRGLIQGARLADQSIALESISLLSKSEQGSSDDQQERREEGDEE